MKVNTRMPVTIEIDGDGILGRSATESTIPSVSGPCAAEVGADPSLFWEMEPAQLCFSMSLSFSAGTTGKSRATPQVGPSFITPEPVAQPLGAGLSPTSGGGGQSPGSASGGQSAASGGSPSSSTPGVQSPDLQVGKTTKLEPFENAQKLSKALKLCKKKSKKQRPICKRQAEKKYSAPSKHRA